MASGGNDNKIRVFDAASGKEIRRLSGHLARTYNAPREKNNANDVLIEQLESDAALAKKPTLSAADAAKVKELRASGEAKHKAGDHKGSVEDLEKAEDLLKIPHVM